MFWSYHILNFWFPWLHIFYLKVTNVLKCRIFATLRPKVSIFSKMKQFIKLKEIPRNGVNRCIELAPNDLLIL